MATPRNSVERRFRVVDEGQYPLFLRRLLLKLVPFRFTPLTTLCDRVVFLLRIPASYM